MNIYAIYKCRQCGKEFQEKTAFHTTEIPVAAMCHELSNTHVDTMYPQLPASHISHNCAYGLFGIADITGFIAQR